MQLNVKFKHCDGCNLGKVIWKNAGGKKYCKQCWNRMQPAVPKEPRKKTAIKKRSSKGRAEDARYSALRFEFLMQHANLRCKANIPGRCGYLATDVHHKRGRGIYYLDTTTWLPVCRACHEWIENHPEEAKKLGFSQSRLDNYDLAKTGT